MNQPSPQRVLVFCLSGLGDAILASPALAALAAQPERFRLTLVAMFGSVAEYLRDQGFTDDVRFEKYLGMSKPALLARALALRRERFDVGVIPYAMNRLGYNLFNYVAGAHRRIGFRYQRQSRRNLPELNTDILDEQPELHAVEENLRWAALLLEVPPQSLPTKLHYRLLPEAERDAAAWLQQHGLATANPLIGIHAACNSLKNQHRRCWPPFRFGELIQRFAASHPEVRFLLFEGPADVEINAALRAAAGQAAATITVASMLPMRTVAALIRRCQVFVSNDSGLMHTAAACKIPCVAIFGPTNPAWVHPWQTPHVVVSRRLPCSPCFYYSSRPLSCPAGLDYACVRELPVDDVERAIWQLLQPATAAAANPQP